MVTFLEQFFQPVDTTDLLNDYKIMWDSMVRNILIEKL